MTPLRGAIRIILPVVVLAGASCGHPTAPSAATTAAGSSKPVASVRVTGPAMLAPRGSAQSLVQYTATGVYADGSTADVTLRATWTTTNFAVVHLANTPGLMQAEGSGDADIQASLDGHVGVLSVMVVKPGTFRLQGRVTASENGGPLLAQLFIDPPSHFTATDGNGLYQMLDLGGPINLHVHADGFVDQVLPLVISSDTTLDVVLVPLLPTTVDLSGTWTASFSASASCRNNLPAIARDRQYDAAIAQQSAQLVLTLNSPTLSDIGARFPVPGQFSIPGFLTESMAVMLTVRGDTDYGDYSSTDLVDQISPTETLGFDGLITGQIAGPEIRGTMSGDFIYQKKGSTSFRPDGVCRATNHVVTIRRR